MRSPQLALGCLTIGTAGLLAAIAHLAAQETRVRATIDQPATVPVVQSAQAGLTADKISHVIVTISGFQPSPAGPFQAIVEAQCGTEKVEIGRFGILPQVAFSTSERAKAQRFSFSLPRESACPQPQHIIIRLMPSHGDGQGASLDIESAELR